MLGLVGFLVEIRLKDFPPTTHLSNFRFYNLSNRLRRNSSAEYGNVVFSCFLSSPILPFHFASLSEKWIGEKVRALIFRYSRSSRNTHITDITIEKRRYGNNWIQKSIPVFARTNKLMKTSSKLLFQWPFLAYHWVERNTTKGMKKRQRFLFILLLKRTDNTRMEPANEWREVNWMNRGRMKELEMEKERNKRGDRVIGRGNERKKKGEDVVHQSIL